MVESPARKTSVLTQLDTKIPSSVTKISKKPPFWQRKTRIYLHVFIKIKIYVKLIIVIDLQSLNWSVTAKKTIAKNILILFKSLTKPQSTAEANESKQDELPTIFNKNYPLFREISEPV